MNASEVTEHFSASLLIIVSVLTVLGQNLFVIKLQYQHIRIIYLLFLYLQKFYL